MTFCELKDTCVLFNHGLFGNASLTQYVRYKYCCGNYTDCPWYINCKGLWKKDEKIREKTSEKF